MGRTGRQERGDRAEAAASSYLEACGWTVLARQLVVGRDEIDVLAREPGSPPVIVVVEVRSRSGPEFGQQEDRVDAAKVRRLYRAMAALRAAARLPDGMALPGGAWRVDLVAVDLAPRAANDGGGDVLAIRHLRGLIPR
ncbi:MAG: YraN family protein [Candidatus Limnocylindrales bacterium]